MRSINISDREKSKINSVLLIAAIMLILLSSNVLSLGIAPSRKVINYEPGAEINLKAAIINNEGHDMKVLLMPKGDLSEYIKLSNSVVHLNSGQEELNIDYTIEIPEDVQLPPGENMIRLAMVELPDELKDQVVVVDGEVMTLSDESPTISATTAVIQQIVLNVPYPESYAQGKLYVTGDKVGEPVTFSISLFNRGQKPLDLKGYVIIKGPTNEEIIRLDAGDAHLAAMAESRFVAVWEGTGNPGEYIAEAYVTYDSKSFVVSQKFTLGQPLISIESLNVKAFRLGTIAKFDVGVLSRWNRMIKDVEGEMRVLDKQGGVVSSFETTRVDLPPHGLSTIAGYWDTEGISIGEYDVNVMLTYEGRTSQKLFETVVSIDEINVKEPVSTVGKVLDAKGKGSQYSLLIILVLVLVVLNLLIFVYFRKLKGMLVGFKQPMAPKKDSEEQKPSSSQLQDMPQQDWWKK